MSISGHIFPNDAVGYFRIASPSRRQPIEPVTLGTFLLGSGAECHLRFGDKAIPKVHTELRVEPGRVLMSAREPSPPVYVNGSVETECRLYDGDLLELGSERLLFRYSSAEQRITLNEQEFLEGLMSRTSDENPQEPTVETLVERLEEQVSLVEELTQNDEDGLADLIRTVARASNSTRTVDSSGITLEQVALQIAEQHEANRLRLDSVTGVLNQVVQQQKLIADSLQALSDRVLSFDSTQSTGPDFPARKAS